MASVLKPVDDTRMLEKIGASLASTGEFEVFIIGYPSSSNSNHSGITLLPLQHFKRFSFKRLQTPWTIFKKINQVKPELIIINTPELLLVAILNRIFFGRKVIYDVLENYYRNIQFTQAYPSIVKWLFAPLVRLSEIISSPFIHHYFLAEKGYEKELRFATPQTVLENKLPKSIALQYNPARTWSRLLFSGTLAPSTGVFDAIKLCKALHHIDQSFSLTLIGYCALPKVLDYIKSEIEGCSFINLIGGDQLIPHHQILEQISKADFGLILYPSNPSTASSIPTKLYEYLAMQLPVLIRHNEESHRLVQTSEAGVVLSEQPDIPRLVADLKSSRFHPRQVESIFWETEAEKLISSLKKL